MDLMNVIHQMNFINDYFRHIRLLISSIDQKALVKVINILSLARQNNRQIFIMGNGGSAASSNHIAEDLCQQGFKAISLSSNSAYLTCLGNDFGFENIFKMQLERFLNPNDIVICISTSGNSPNILKAAEHARSKNNTVISLTGFDGGNLPMLSSSTLHIPSELKEAGPIEDIHLMIFHLIALYFKYPMGIDKK